MDIIRYIRLTTVYLLHFKLHSYISDIIFHVKVDVLLISCINLSQTLLESLRNMWRILQYYTIISNQFTSIFFILNHFSVKLFWGALINVYYLFILSNTENVKIVKATNLQKLTTVETIHEIPRIWLEHCQSIWFMNPILKGDFFVGGGG